MSWPGVIKPGRIATTVSTVDLLPTVVELATGQAVDVAVVSGRSHARALRGEAQATSAPVFAELRVAGRYSWAVISDGFKLVVDEVGGPAGLYNLETDPHEQIPINDKGRAKRMAQAFDLARKIRPVLSAGTAKQAAAQADVERLRALGYLDEPGDGR
jgi:choline-sulfatase